MVNINFYKKIAQNIFIFIAFLFVVNFLFDSFNFGKLIIKPKHLFVKEKYDDKWNIFKNTLIIEGASHKLVEVDINYNMNNEVEDYDLKIFKYSTQRHYFVENNKYYVMLNEYGKAEIPIVIMIESDKDLNESSVKLSVKYIQDEVNSNGLRN